MDWNLKTPSSGLTEFEEQLRMPQMNPAATQSKAKEEANSGPDRGWLVLNRARAAL